MYLRILIAFDGAIESSSVVRECLQLGLSPRAEIHLAGLIQSYAHMLIGDHASDAMFALEQGLPAEQQKMRCELDAACALLRESGLNAETHLVVGEAADVVRRLTEQLQIDLLIVGQMWKKPRGLRWRRSSVDTLLASAAGCSVLLAAARHSRSPP